MTSLDKLISKKYSFVNRILFFIAFVLTGLAILTGSYISDKENINVGMISPKRYIAPRDIVDVQATEKLKQEAMDSVGPLYKHDTQVQETSIASIQDFFKDVQGVLESATEVDGVLTYNKDAVLKLPVALSERQYQGYGELTENSKAAFQADVIQIANFIFDQGITEESMPKAMELLDDNITKLSWSTDLKNMAKLILTAALTPNLVLDEEAIALSKEQKAGEVPDVMIYKNQKIVDEGEIITEKIYSLLNDLNLINHDYSDNFVPLIGSIGMMVLLFFAAALYFSTQQKSLMKKTNEMLVLFTVYIVMIFIIRLTAQMSVYSVIPVSLFAILVSMLVSTKVAILMNVFVSIMAALIFNGNMEFLIFYVVSGTLSALFVQFTEKRNRIILVSGAVGLANIITYFVVGLFFENGYSETLLHQSLYSGLTGLLTVLIAVGSLPIWEALFDVNTQVKLLELTNPNNELMRRLMIEAPGTYHHSLIVANLAETAAYDIEANPTLARVGAYYHDIGKLKNPLLFAENQAGENPHNKLSPFESVEIIKDHVLYGKVLAEAAKLPKIVTSFVVQHHGTTLVKFFYYKACKDNPDQVVPEKDFRYPGPKPQIRETAIVMLADTVEAAVRSTLSNGKNLDQAEQLIQTLIKDKLDDGQLDESGLSIRDLTTIRKSFLKVFHGMYHNRVAYPKAEEMKAAIEKEKQAEKRLLEKEEKSNTSPEPEKKAAENMEGKHDSTD